LDTVILGNQTWASTNLMDPVFRNGDQIPVVNNYIDWERLSINEQPCCAYVDNKPSMSKYGLLFNGYACIDSRNIAPDGFRVPKIQDIITLAENLGFPNENDDRIYYNGKVAYTLKSEKTWKKSFFGEPGNNQTGLSFLAGGTLGLKYGELEFNDKGTTAGHWLFDEYLPKEGVRFFPAPPDNWPKNRFHSFSIGTGGNHCLSVGDDLLMGGLFIRLIKE
jgi:uncharacterized protein (TIGR02145 family)